MLPLIIACAQAPDPVPVYTGALERVRAQPADAVEICSVLHDKDLRNDCILAGAQRVGAPHLGATLCEAIDVALWQEECFFLLAEDNQGDCARAGRFTMDCRMHQWTLVLREALPSDAQPGRFEEALRPQMRAIGLNPDQDQGWWTAYRAVLGKQLPLDLAACARAPDAHMIELCRRVGLQIYGDRLNYVRDTTGFPCDGGPLPASLAADPDPELDTLIASRRAQDLCR